MFGRGSSDKKDRVKLEKGAYKRAFRAFRYLKPYKFVFILGLFFLFISSVTTLGFPYLLGSLFDSEQTSATNEFDFSNLDNINVIIVLLFIIFSANAVFSFFRIYLFTWVAERALRDIRNDVFQKLLYSKISFFDTNKVGELTSRVATDINQLQDLLVTSLAEFIRQWITVIVSIALIAYFSVKLLMILLAVVPVIIVLVIIFGKYIKKLSKRTQDAAAESNTLLNDALTGIKNVKAFSNEKFELARYFRKSDEIKDLAVKGSIARGLFAGFIILGLFGSVTFVIYKGYEMTLTDELPREQFYQFILFTIFLAASFGGLGSLFGVIQKAVGATERVLDLIDNETEPSNNISKSSKITGEIAFRNVSFHYESRPDVQVLENVSFKINQGETVALVGSSGSGKTTIASLLLRFYEINEGNIAIGNTDYGDLSINDIRREMAYVPQEVILFGGTIKENIAYGNPEASDEMIRAAAEQANALEFIDRFPDKMETLVGDRGVQLSGGQKQRLAIARALLKDPSMLILDEATSALDTESEKLVQDALDKLMQGRTSLVIAHRLSTIKNADKILVLNQGKIIEEGKHADLLARDGQYAKLIEMQQVINS